MPVFATDTDLLHWEPQVPSDAASVAQTVLAGTGTLEGTAFTLDAGSLTDASIAPNHVITLGAPISGSFPIVSVTSSTVLTLSVLYDQLDPTGGSGTPWNAGAGSGIDFAIRTFWPQRLVVTQQLLQAAGLEQADFDRILNPEDLKRPCVLGTLAMIYSALAATLPATDSALARADLYEKLYRRALRAVRLDIDSDGDGEIDIRRPLNVLQLRRG